VTPDPWQADLLRSTATRLLLLASRQSGKSHTVALLGAHTALYEDNALVLIVAPTERQSKETFRKMVGAFHALGWPVPAEALGAQSLQLANGSRVIALPGTGATIRGYSNPRLTILDEAAQIPDDLLQAIFPVLSLNKGRLLALSSAYGRRGWFFDCWIGEDGAPPWERYKVPWKECPRVSPQVVEEALRLFGPQYVASEFECEFVDAVGSLFNSADVEASIKEYEQPWNLERFMPEWT
jgi:hypothetical protein